MSNFYKDPPAVPCPAEISEYLRRRYELNQAFHLFMDKYSTMRYNVDRDTRLQCKIVI